ncbi:hypothetical protein E6H30_08595 [Candidatus Bathyarchaeota archaeon]|nr:MAG: hypothetical protein E6H30_08595 [Candidatus Bathyarchaeota archaeon]
MPPIYSLDPNIPMLWGDYGGILAHGMGGRSREGQFEIERAGPFVPPISLPFNAIIVTDVFKKELETSGLRGLSFNPVVKKRIVKLDWEKWDWKAADPAKYPSEGEPENYILENPHSPDTAEKIGPLWELLIEENADTEPVMASAGVPEQILLRLDRWDGRDFFRAKGVGFYYVTDSAKAWLETRVSEWISFRASTVKQ